MAERGEWVLAAGGNTARTDDGSTLLKLLAWMSPAFPVGAYAYSHGLEWAVEAGTVRSAEALRAWVEDVLRQGTGRQDAILLARVWQAVRAGDGCGAVAVAELGAALQPSRERHLEATQQGRAFELGARAAWGPSGFDELSRAGVGEITYATAVGVAAAAHGLDLAPTLTAYLHAFAANLVSAGVRLIPLGQSDGLKVVASLEPTILALAREAPGASLNDIGGCAILSDIASMRHETQYTRLFRT